MPPASLGTIKFRPQIGLRELMPVLLFAACVILVTGLTFVAGPKQGFMALLACGIFLACFLNMKLALMFFALGILFSPEIPLGAMAGFRSLKVRMEDVLAVIFLLGWAAQIAVGREQAIFRKTTLNVPIMVYMAMCIVCTARGYSVDAVYPTTAVFFLAKYAQFFFVYFLAVNFVRTYGQVRNLLIAGAVVVGLFCLHAYYQIPSIRIFTNARLTAPFSNTPDSTSIGGILAVVMAVLVGIFLHTKSGKQRFWIAAGLLFMLFPFYYTLSRTAYGAFAFMLIVIAVVTRSKPLILGLLFLACTWQYVLPDVVVDRISFTWEDARAYGVDTSSQERLLVYEKTWYQITTGVMPFLMGFGVSAHDVLDAQYARTVTEVGFIGLGIFFWIFYVIFKEVLRIYRRSRIPWVKGLAVGFLAGFLGLIVHGFGAITFTLIRTMEMFWLMTGLLFSYGLIMDEHEAGLPSEA